MEKPMHARVPQHLTPLLRLAESIGGKVAQLCHQGNNLVPLALSTADKGRAYRQRSDSVDGIHFLVFSQKTKLRKTRVSKGR